MRGHRLDTCGCPKKSLMQFEPPKMREDPNTAKRAWTDMGLLLPLCLSHTHPASVGLFFAAPLTFSLLRLHIFTPWQRSHNNHYVCKHAALSALPIAGLMPINILLGKLNKKYNSAPSR